MMKRNLITPLIFMPFRLKLFKREYSNAIVNVLDVGCGNHSPSLTKRWYPTWKYHGLDREEYSTDEYDKKAMAKYYSLDLSNDNLESIPNNYYDIVIMSHIIEHLHNGLKIVEFLIQKIKSGGKIYIEFPSERSLSLPSMSGSLNFCDDPTHVRIYKIADLANLLLENNFRIIRAGTRRDKVMILTFPFRLLLKFVIGRKIGGGDFWDVTGFASYVYAKKL